MLRTHEQLDDFVDQLTSELNYGEIAIAIDCHTQVQFESIGGAGAIVDDDDQLARTATALATVSARSKRHVRDPGLVAPE